MEECVVADGAVVSFPFANLEGAKRWPAIILAAGPMEIASSVQSQAAPGHNRSEWGERIVPIGTLPHD